jgi:hypothetical protein
MCNQQVTGVVILKNKKIEYFQRLSSVGVHYTKVHYSQLTSSYC